MDDNHDNKKNTRLPYEDWKDNPFNPTTNFSLLGYIIDFYGKKKRNKSVIDFKIGK